MRVGKYDIFHQIVIATVNYISNLIEIHENYPDIKVRERGGTQKKKK